MALGEDARGPPIISSEESPDTVTPANPAKLGTKLDQTENVPLESLSLEPDHAAAAAGASQETEKAALQDNNQLQDAAGDNADKKSSSAHSKEDLAGDTDFVSVKSTSNTEDGDLVKHRVSSIYR